MADKVGAPYNTIPGEIALWGKAGGFGYASLCGSIIGACSAISLTVPQKDSKKLVNELFAWYEQTPFPSDIANQMAHAQKFPVKKYKSTEILPQTVSESVICHVSVTKFCQKAEVASKSKPRSERCARLTSDVATFTAEMLNRYHSGKYAAVFGQKKETQECTTCHESGQPYDEGGYTRGRMECGSCHDEEPDHTEA